MRKQPQARTKVQKLLRLPADLASRLDRMARAERRSTQGQILILVDEAIRAREQAGRAA